MPDKYAVTGLLLVASAVLLILVKGFIVNVRQVPAGELIGEQEITTRTDILSCRYLTIHGFEVRNYWQPPARARGNLPCPLFMRD